ncbi:MAG: UbiA family prenyltransferase [Akkermansiaceae bacterium]
MTNQRLIDLLAMSRFANLPTVWSNALLGFVISTTLTGIPSFQTIALLSLGLSCLYLGGCFFNDWMDIEFDTKHRPDRPIPAGRWSRKTIGLFALVLLISGLVLIGLVSLASLIFAIGIVICIALYTKWHKTNLFSLLFMAGARMLIYPTCVHSGLTLPQLQNIIPAHLPVLILFCISLASYILGISLTARFEARKDAPEKTPVVPLICLSLPAFLISGILLILGHPLAALIPLVIFGGVLIFIIKRLQRTGDIGTFVAGALAAIPLVDGLFVMRDGIASGNIFLIVICPILALLAFGLQKIAPAT